MGAAQGFAVGMFNHAAKKMASKGVESTENKTDNNENQYSLLFDGHTLKMYINEKEILSMKAVSGREGHNNDFSVNSQKDKGNGPLPEGYYQINSEAVQHYEDLSFIQRVKSSLGGGEWPGGKNSWGSERVWINPKSGTETYGRSGFTIHGGSVYGSAGCIDLGPNSSVFFKALILAKGYVNLTVKY